MLTSDRQPITNVELSHWSGTLTVKNLKLLMRWSLLNLDLLKLRLAHPIELPLKIPFPILMLTDHDQEILFTCLSNRVI